MYANGRYIARIGVLAVALTFGGAVATTTAGIAWADDSTSAESPSKSTGSETSGAQSTSPAKTDPPPGPAGLASDQSEAIASSDDSVTTPEGDEEKPTDGEPPSSPSQSETILDAGVIVRSSGGAHTSGSDEPVTANDDKVVVSSSGGAHTSGSDDPVTANDDGSSDFTQPARAKTKLADTLSRHMAEARGSLTQARVAVKGLVQRSAAAAPTPDEPETLGQPSPTKISVLHAPEPDPSEPSKPRPAEQLAACVCTAIDTLSPVVQRVTTAINELVFGTGTGVPIDSPILLAVVGWVRRQVDDALASPLGTEVLRLVRQAELESAKFTQDLCGGPTTGLPVDLERTVIVSGLDEPVDFRFLPDDPDDPADGGILIAEKGGAIKLHQDGQPLTTVVVLPTLTDFESGIGGIEVDPNFAENHYVYVSYTRADNKDVLSRFTLQGDQDAILASEVVLVESSDPAGPIHHGGEIHYRTEDGVDYLYWATGDNSTSTNAQDLSKTHGKILRIHPDGSIPEDNPFVGVEGAREEIWAYGLRNPFRFTFTPDGQMLVGDVGAAEWEELNLVTRGANYGWPNAEGACEGCGYVDPIWAYPHSAETAGTGSITSVLVYTGDTLPEEYAGKVFVADYTLGWIKVLEFDSEYTTLISEQTLDGEAGTTVKLAQGPDGNIYQLNIYPGQLSVIAPADGNRAPTAVLTATPANGYAPLEVQFSSAGSSDPDLFTNLTYHWDFGDGTTSTDANPVKTYATNGNYDVTLTVSDGDETGTATETIVVGSTAPVVEITSPVHESNYNAGDTITFTGTATDADEELPDSAYEWTVVFHHADHVHPVVSGVTGKSGSITVPRDPHNGADTWYAITLTVTDSSGLRTTERVEVYPNLVTLTVNANDPDAQFTIDGQPRTGSYTEQAVVGVERVLGAPSPQTVNGQQLVFNNWSDGGTQNHTITTPATDVTYTVTYDTVPTVL
ncbi:PQQ-dependent sugar dehydrogenase [Micromonospora sp. WMMD736]|uniref:PQQ-dependent sugar dehydrogenase n=1 Tax=Micromonospora sp. WMMD736 TaxID=3404112 RepID=UPI003B95BC5C